MEFKKVPIMLQKGQVVTSLYHSPFDFNLFYLITLAKTGIKLRIILDDIDNIGIDREGKNEGYSFKEKYFLSKTGRTNIRPLSLNVPKHFFSNLSSPLLRDLDTFLGIRNLKDQLGCENVTVEHWIQQTTKKFGSWSLVGPDRSFACMSVDDNFIKAMQTSKNHIKAILSEFKTDNNDPFEFIDWLFDENIKTSITISDYYHNILNKIIKRFGLEKNVYVGRMSDIFLQENNETLLKEFLNDEVLGNFYKVALDIDGKKDPDNFPFYSISKKSGERLLPIKNYLDNPQEHLIAPKVLMLNSFENLVLPYHAIDKSNVHARELMYSHEKINCNQVFCDDKWLDWLQNFNITPNMENNLHNQEFVMSGSFLKKVSWNSNSDFKENYKIWLKNSTVTAIEQSKYPLIFLALLQEKIFYKEIPNFYKLIIE